MKILKKLALISLLFAGIILSQYFADRSQAKEIKPSPYVPSAQVVQGIDLGLDSAASSLYWLKTIQYFGDWQTDNYQKLVDYIKLANDLDPKFSHPYAFATLILPSLGQTDQAREIGNAGIEKSDPDWEIPYYMAISYHDKQDSVNAAKYFDIAAHTAGAPDNVKWLASNYGSRPDTRAQTEQIWQNIADSSKDEELQKRADAYVYHFKLMDFLEQAAAEYKKAYGAYPDPIDKLVDGKILKEIPEDPFGYQFNIDETGRARAKFSS